MCPALQTFNETASPSLPTIFFLLLYIVDTPKLFLRGCKFVLIKTFFFSLIAFPLQIMHTQVC